MRGIDTQVRKYRRRIFVEISKLAYESKDLNDDILALPYKIVDYEESPFQSVYRERAIVRERLRLAMGLSLVITFEELLGMFEAKGLLMEEINAQDSFDDATACGRGYGVAGGVASAIEACIKKYYPDIEVNIEHAESLAECKKMLMLAKAGRKNGCLIEGMACPGGCVAGAGTNIAVAAATKNVNAFKQSSERQLPPLQ